MNSTVKDAHQVAKHGNTREFNRILLSFLKGFRA